METFAVHKVNDNLVVSMNKLPGFGKLGTCVLRYKGDNTLIEVYYAGGYYKRHQGAKALKEVEDQITRLAKNYATKRGMEGTIVRLNYTSIIRGEIEREHQI